MLRSPLSRFALPTDGARLRREPPLEVAAEDLLTRESAPSPAQSGDAKTGLSRRRSRVRVPSLTSPIGKPISAALEATTAARPGPRGGEKEQDRNARARLECMGATEGSFAR